MILKNACIQGELKTLVLEDGRIAAVRETGREGIDLEGKRVIPGLIDVHTHGCGGVDTMDADFAPLCRFYAECGTTSFLPTTMTMPEEDLLRVCTAKTDFPGAHVLGFHLEGPYISVKYKGAQNEAYIRKPSLDEFAALPNVSMITLAPEEDGAMAFIRQASRTCTVSLGHTDCDYETAIEAIDSGATCLTHTCNAMKPLLHRAPGPIGAGVEKHIYAQVIGDGFHVQKPMLLTLYRAFGADRVVLISDSLACAGLPDGRYTSGGLPVELKGDAAYLEDGTVAGSRTMLFECLKRVAACGIPFDDAVRMASATPGELLGVNKGKIEQGFDADLLILDHDLQIDSVLLDGDVFSSRSL